jgi:hypothetical protein
MNQPMSQQYPPAGALWAKVSSSRSVAAVVAADLDDQEDAIVAELLPSLIAAARAILAAVQ